MTGEHVHPDLAAVDHAHADLDERVRDISARVTGLVALGEAITADIADILTRLAALEPEPFTADYWVGGNGNDANDGLGPERPWKSLNKAFATAAAGKVIGLLGNGVITGGALYDKALTLAVAPGEDVQVQGPGRYSLRLQRANGTHVDASRGSLTMLPPLTIAEPAAADGTDPGATRQACVEITDSSDLRVHGDVLVRAGTDFGILAQGTCLRNYVVADVTDAGHGFMLKGNQGIGSDRSWYGGAAFDCGRMIRNTATGGDDYGAVGFVFENSTGGGLLEGWEAVGCYAASRDYGADGGGLELYDASDAVVQRGTVTDCEGGFETGGSAGKGCHRNQVSLVLRGSLAAGATAAGKPVRSPGFLLRNFEASTLDVDVDITAARCIGEIYSEGNFAGPIDNSTVNVRWVDRGVPLWGNYSPPASTTVTVTKVPL